MICLNILIDSSWTFSGFMIIQEDYFCSFSAKTMLVTTLYCQYSIDDFMMTTICRCWWLFGMLAIIAYESPQ